MPASPGMARFLARQDRGELRTIAGRVAQSLRTIFDPVVFETYRLSVAGITLWNMVYFKGKPR